MFCGPSKLKKLGGRGSSSVRVYTCLMPVCVMATTSAALLGVADAASLHPGDMTSGGCMQSETNKL